MKNLFKYQVRLLGLFFLFFSVISCQREGYVEPSTKADFNGLKVALPTTFPDKVLTFTADDLKNLYYTGSKNAKVGNEPPVSLGEYIVILKEVKREYPDLTQMKDEEIQKVFKYFPDLDKKGVYENIDTINDFFEKLISYDVIKRLPSSGAAKGGKKAAYPYSLNSCEFWYIAEHPRMAEGMEKATNLAFQYELQATGASNNNYQGYGDAIRHAMWTVLIGKYACGSYGTIDKAAEKALGFTNMHECESPAGADKEMDLHNNRVGLEYYKSKAVRVTVSCFLGICNHNILVQGSDQDIINDITAKPVITTQDVNVINSTNLGTLVKLN